tara:strand:+ start:37147 stop:37314 length:168 start_codon:yes stop_codon:yes gene_type:complete
LKDALRESTGSPGSGGLLCVVQGTAEHRGPLEAVTDMVDSPAISVPPDERLLALL